MEKSAPHSVSKKSARAAAFATVLEARRLMPKATPIKRYPTIPTYATGSTPNSRAYVLCCTAFQSPTGPHSATQCLRMRRLDVRQIARVAEAKRCERYAGVDLPGVTRLPHGGDRPP